MNTHDGSLTDRQKLGIGILIGVLCVVLFWNFFTRDSDGNPSPDPITVSGYAGSLKVEFLRNPEVVNIMKEKYGVTVDVEARSTASILCDVPVEGADFLWVGDQTQIDTYEDCRNRSDSNQNIFTSHVVLYSWVDITNSLIDAGVVTQAEDGGYRADMVKLVELIDADLSWTDLGLDGYSNPVLVETTDPNGSTSGSHFAALLANSMNCMKVVTNSDLPPILPDTHSYFEKLGYMPDKSAELFKLYLTIGPGSYPLVALYEAQIVEHMASNPDQINAVKNQLRLIYPEPTVWITNPIIMLSEGGKRLRTALLDPEIQQLAWERNGFRPIEPSVRPDLSIVPLPLPENVTASMDVPANPVMDQIKEAVTPDYVPDPNAAPRKDCAAEQQHPSPTKPPESPSAAIKEDW